MAATQTSQLLLGWAGLGWALSHLLMMSCWHLLPRHMFGLSRPFFLPPPSPHAFLLILSFTAVRNKSRRPNVSAGSLEECPQLGWEAESGRGVLGCRDQRTLRWVTGSSQGSPVCSHSLPDTSPLFRGQTPLGVREWRPGSNLTI